jgi:hypothetical protein
MSSSPDSFDSSSSSIGMLRMSPPRTYPLFGSKLGKNGSDESGIDRGDSPDHSPVCLIICLAFVRF